MGVLDPKADLGREGVRRLLRLWMRERERVRERERDRDTERER